MSGLRKLIPLADRVLIKRIKPVTKTAGGILLPDSNVSKANEGEVIAVGPGYTSRDGTKIAVTLEVGDKVVLPEYGGLSLKIEDEEAFIFRCDEILAKYVK